MYSGRRCGDFVLLLALMLPFAIDESDGTDGMSSAGSVGEVGVGALLLCANVEDVAGALFELVEGRLAVVPPLAAIPALVRPKRACAAPIDVRRWVSCDDQTSMMARSSVWKSLFV